MSFYNDGQVDATSREQRLVADRARLRADLRAEYMKQLTNPHVHGQGGYLFDPAMQRWMSMRANQYYYFKPNPKTLIYPVGILGTVAFFAWLFRSRRAARENLYRTGQVSYRAREFKFV